MIVLEVSSVNRAFREIKGESPPVGAFVQDIIGGVPYRVFFAKSPEGVCHAIGERRG